MKKSSGVESELERSFASGLRRGRRLVCPAERSSALTTLSNVGVTGIVSGCNLQAGCLEANCRRAVARPSRGARLGLREHVVPGLRVPSPQFLRAVSREPTPAPVFGARTGADQSEAAIIRLRPLPPR